MSDTPTVQKEELMKDRVRRVAIIKLAVIFALLIGVLVLVAVVFLGKLG